MPGPWIRASCSADHFRSSTQQAHAVLLTRHALQSKACDVQNAAKVTSLLSAVHLHCSNNCHCHVTSTHVILHQESFYTTMAITLHVPHACLSQDCRPKQGSQHAECHTTAAALQKITLTPHHVGPLQHTIHTSNQHGSTSIYTPTLIPTRG